MGKQAIFAIVFTFCSCIQSSSHGAKILGVFPSSSRSHYIIGSALMRGLAGKGHDVSAITAFPSSDRTANFEEIPIPAILEHFKELHRSLQQAGDKFFIQTYKEMVDIGRTLSETVLIQPTVQELLTSTNRTFDLVISEIFVTDALFGFGQHFNAPVIGISPMGNTLWASVLSGSPIPASFMPNVFLGNTQHMSFLERCSNLAAVTVQYLGYYLNWRPYQSNVYDKFFPNAKVSLRQVLENVSLILLNQHISIGNPEPLLQSVIEVGGLHIPRRLKPLPSKIQEFLDNAQDGAIYFSLGTNWKSESLRKDKLDAILTTFRSIKQRVLWKYENTTLPGMSDNVLIGEWFPQNEILAHPNLKLFITHGGLLGTTEAVYHGKPLLGIPILCDQFVNMARAVAAGYALQVPYSQINGENLKNAISKLLTHSQFAKQAKLVSARYRDQPLAPLDNAIFWIEYVLRHKGAPHLRSVALDLNFIQYHSLDTIAAVYGAALLMAYFLVRLTMHFISSIGNSDNDSKTKNE